MTPFEQRLERAESITERLAWVTNSTVSQEAAKQLTTLIRDAKRHHALGKEQLAMEILEWAAP